MSTRKLDPKDPNSFQIVEEIIRQTRGEWTGEANVIDVRPAIKVVGGKALPDVLAIGFHVLEKVPPELLADRGFKRIPKVIQRVPTDVIPARQPALDGHVDTKATRSQMFDTLVGGIAVGNANIHAYGTLGMTLLAVSDGRMLGLTNEHVLVFDIDGHVGDEVQQPRYYLWNEVSLDDASCCPNGQLHYRPVNNYIVDGAMAVFAACAIAAAASDRIDPHRRGQQATVPNPAERTLRETVSMSIDYPVIPNPGTPFTVSTDWRYKRETDAGVLEYAVKEDVQNEHVLSMQHLITDKKSYRRGERVYLIAILGTGSEQETCESFFVTAALLSPSHQRAYKVVLRPAQIASSRLKVLTHGAAQHQVERETVRRCFGFANYPVGKSFVGPTLIDSLVYDPAGFTCSLLGPTATLPAALRFPSHGVAIRLPRPAHRVSATVVVRGGDVKLSGYRGTRSVGSAVAVAGRRTPQTVTISAASIDSVVLTGGSSESLLLEVCTEGKVRAACVYAGSVQLAADEELGPWKTFVFAQTVNDTARGLDPVVAAQTIGGLPATTNLVDVGGSDNITYGHSCNVELAPDGDFVVVP